MGGRHVCVWLSWGTCGPFPFFSLQEVSLHWTSPFLLSCHILPRPPNFVSLFALSQCWISMPFFLAPRCSTAAPSGPQAKLLGYSSFVPEATVPGKDGGMAKNPPPLTPTTISGVLLSVANIGETIPLRWALEKCISPWASHFKGIKVTWNMFLQVPRSPTGRQRDSVRTREKVRRSSLKKTQILRENESSGIWRIHWTAVEKGLTCSVWEALGLQKQKLQGNSFWIL